MNRPTLIVLKTLVWLSCLASLCWLVWGAFTNNLGPNATGAIAYATGRTTLRLLAITLAISPLRRMLPRLSLAHQIPPPARSLRFLLRHSAHAYLGRSLQQLRPPSDAG